MNNETMTQRHSTGEICPACECEIVFSGGGPSVLVECDCGRVTAIGPELPSAA